MPFAVSLIIATIIVGIGIWKAMEWRYSGIIGRLRDERDCLQRNIKKRPEAAPTIKKFGQAEISFEEPPKLEAARQPAPASPLKERVLLGPTVTPEFLMRIGEGKTCLQAEKATEVYIGKWMRFTGRLDNVARQEPYLVVTFQRPDDGLTISQRLATSVNMYFLDDHKRLEVLHAGDEITVEGELENVSFMGLRLDRCRIISPTSDA